MEDDKPTEALPQNHIDCWLDGITPTEFCEIKKHSGYTTHYQNLMGPYYSEGSLMKNCSFENEADFTDEHERMATLAKTINPIATVRSFYYLANEETSIYRRQS